ncbi:Pre-rRNA-processing protein esf1 [Golovinomyces cichoracearum]|uniref:Pre-rRNA-processing protein esf1 n=1 Tax=Golovinomyces cichoracearum TaxID=62708 RepID=A0A420HR72_9PEZI|nr:Pre-rRNA-processing protein esf1 [Golovinomyces cichoracearum]
MPKPMRPKASKAASEISDPRFSFIATDPRFRLPSKKSTRTKLDKRFSRMLTDDDFYRSARVDRYGRKLDGGTKKKALERLYLPADENDEEHNDSSRSDSETNQEKDDKISQIQSHEKIYDPARGGGFSSSEDEESSDDSGADVGLEEVEFPDIFAAQMAVEMGDISSRFAVVNLDWDNIKSDDLFAVFSSFLPPGGKIHKVSIYPSEFGKERMDREELEGPPKEIFATNEQDKLSEDELSEDDEKIAQSIQKPDDGVEYNSSTLRQYQLERLRYFYAVVICSSPSVAQAIYEATDGREYLSSANFLDLRFIPDEVEFEDKARDECTEIPSGYRPIEFITTALQHSKVKLTWDTEPSENKRKEDISKAFSGAPSEINENDLRAYIGSDSESDRELLETTDDTPKISKKELARQKTRAALGLLNNEAGSKTKKNTGPVGDMEVTFTAGLSSSNDNGVFQNQPVPDETTAERYIRLEKERKARRRERAKAKRENCDPDSAICDNQQLDVDKTENLNDPGFQDPFFAAADEAPAASKKNSSQRKAERLAKREKKIAQAEESAAQKKQLEKIMEVDDNANGIRAEDHFNMNEIMRSEKKHKIKSKKKHFESKRGGLQESFEMDVADPRFEKVFESHEYAIDPSNPRFKATEAMKKLLDEGRRKRNFADEIEPSIPHKKRKEREMESELTGLIEKVKKTKKSL